MNAIHLGLLLAAMPLSSAVVPSITWVSDLNCGSVIAVTSGTLTLGTTSAPSGTRTVTGGTQLGGSPVISLGAFTLAGTTGDPWTVRALGGTLDLKFGIYKISVPNNTIRFTAGSGTFPTAATLYFGCTANIASPSGNPSGTYTGQLTLQVRDSFTSWSSLQTFNVSIKVDPTPISIAKTTDMSFGAILAGGAGTVVLTPTGGRTPTGGVSTSPADAGHAASFTVSGAFNALYGIVLPASAVLSSPGGDSMTVNAFSVSSPVPPTGHLNATGSQQLNVGARLNLATGQAPGSYGGSFLVTVAYN